MRVNPANGDHHAVAPDVEFFMPVGVALDAADCEEGSPSADEAFVARPGTRGAAVPAPDDPHAVDLALSPAQVEKLRRWIADGAPR